MTTDPYCSRDPETPVNRDDRIKSALLRSEISFWRELIDSCPKSHCPESLERMRQALALAESKLAGGLNASCIRSANVYHINRKRELPV
jgi:hypothetical protein